MSKTNVKQEEMFKDAKRYLASAKKLLGIGEIRAAYSSMRDSLEAAIKKLCILSNIESNTKETTLEEMINILFDSKVIDNDTKVKMHILRKECNRGGAHIELGKNEKTSSEATDTLKLLVEVLEFLDKDAENINFNEINKKNNRPLSLPNYYNRKLIAGKWVREKKEPFLISEYVEMLEKAEKGDISTMIDLAIGFLPEKMSLNDRQLITNNENIVDGYYYWCLRAAIKGCGMLLEGKEIPYKYIATTFWDSICYLIYIYTQFTDESGDHFVFPPAKKYSLNNIEIRSLCNNSIMGLICSFSLCILEIINKFDLEQIIAPFHSEMFNDTKYIVQYIYLLSIYIITLENTDMNIVEEYKKSSSRDEVYPVKIEKEIVEGFESYFEKKEDSYIVGLKGLWTIASPNNFAYMLTYRLIGSDYKVPILRLQIRDKNKEIEEKNINLENQIEKNKVLATVILLFILFGLPLLCIIDFFTVEIMPPIDLIYVLFITPTLFKKSEWLMDKICKIIFK